MPPAPAKPMFDPANPQLIDAILPNLTALATPPGLEPAALPKAPPGYVPSPGLPGSIARAVTAPAAGPAPIAPGRIAEALRPAPAAARAAAPAAAPAVTQPVGLAAYLKAHPVAEEAPEQYKPPGFFRRALLGLSAGAAGWGHPEIGASIVERYNQEIANREQQTAEENRQLPLENQAREQQAYDQYLGQQAKQAEVANVASEIRAREAPRPAETAPDHWTVIPDTNWEVNAATGQSRQVPGMAGPGPRGGVNHPIAGSVDGHPAFAVYSPGTGFTDPASGQVLANFKPAERGNVMSGYAAARLLDYAYRYDPRLLPMAVKAVQESMGPGAPGMPTSAPTAQPQDAAGNPVGLGQPIAPTSSTRSRGQFSQAVVDLAGRLRGEIGKLGDQLGPLAGRWHDFYAGTVGADNPQFFGLYTDLHNLATAWMRVHANSDKARDEFEQMLSAAKSPDNLLASIGSIERQAQDYVREGTGRPAEQTAKPASGAASFEGTIAETPQGKVILRGGKWVPYGR